MNQGQSISPANAYTEVLKTDSDSALGWLAIGVFSALTLLGIALSLGQSLSIAFTAGSLGVGLLLYFRCPIMYVSFTCWLWFLVPLVRRISDFRGGYAEPSPFLLAPFVVTAITGIALGEYLPKMLRKGGFPFALVFIGLFYALLVGIAQGFDLTSIVTSLLGWVAPPLMGFYLFVHWRDYPTYRHVIQKTFVWAVLIMGCYGIYQYLTAPEWDMFWLAQSGFTSAGRREPMGFRIWSTLNSPGPFGNMMRACLLVLFSVRSKILVPSLITGYLAFLLSMVRSAWGGWVIGVLVLITSLKSKYQMQLIITLLVFGLALFPLASLDSFSAIGERVGSFSNLGNDGSANTRLATFGLLVEPALTNLVGYGIGDRHYEWGIFTFLFNLGWIGTIFYVGGLIVLIIRLFEGQDSKHDKFVAAARAVVLSTMIQLPFGSLMIDSSGFMLWVMLGMGIAAKKYHREQRLHQLPPPA
ncbi:O-antigen ligase domain-containing protein [cf. Phormidesmis sp. LEGE 11477]|uniref:O-antigen ligase domain-containing protein n=1 Tax=cf. Phormidesmis sp. LEGE 11477 TaxID=1828680 RepID=UPI00187F267D|nr:O-antigen ligase domain-containing protein [cf. Phormidesmis sp. LEGE 11477]MBE9062322.1 O-antigen ligase domain-containing protein [cf. Phormidesmis sp. LEGE 11477]